MTRMIVAILFAVTAALGLLGALAWRYTTEANSKFPPIGSIVSAGGAKLHMKLHGDPDAATTVVLIHGASANLREFEQNLAPALAEHVRVLSIDRPGHGHSDRTPGSHRLEEQARLIAAGISEVRDGPVIVVGHSFGGAVSLRLALDYPDLLQGVVLLAPATHPWDGDTTWYNRAAAHPVLGRPFSWLVTQVGPGMAGDGIQNVFKPNPIPEEYAASLGLPLLFRPGNFRANGQDMAAANNEFAAQSKRYPDLDLPIVAFSPSRDHVLSPKIHAYALSKQVEHLDLRVLPETGHMPHHFHVEEIVEAVRSLASRERSR